MNSKRTIAERITGQPSVSSGIALTFFEMVRKFKPMGALDDWLVRLAPVRGYRSSSESPTAPGHGRHA